MRRFVDAKAGHAIDLGIEPGVLVAEETNLRTSGPDEVIEPLGFASPAGPASMPFEDHSGRGAVNQEHIDAVARDQRIDLATGVRPLPKSLQVARPALAVGRPEAAAQASDGERLVAVVDIEPGAVAQVEEPGQHLAVSVLGLVSKHVGEVDVLSVIGLHEVNGTNSDGALGWAPDFPAEAAGWSLSLLLELYPQRQRSAAGTRVIRGVEEKADGWVKMLEGVVSQLATKKQRKRRS